MNDMTLREVCNIAGVSRRAVQGYENAGLVSATSKNTRGYLLYNEMAQERIKRIRLFQNMGFSIKEIQEFIDGPNHVLKKALIKRERELKGEVNQKKKMIKVIRKMLNQL